MSERAERLSSPDNFITEFNREGVESVYIPNEITRIAPGAERLLGSHHVGESYAGGRLTFPLTDAYSSLTGDETERLRAGGKVHLRQDAGRHHHRDLSLEPSKDFTVEAAPGTLRYGIDTIRHLVDKGMGLSVTAKQPNQKTKPRFWYFNPAYVRDAEMSVRGLCSDGEATEDWELVDELNKKGGRFGVPLLMGVFKQLPAPRDQVEENYSGPYQIKLYPFERLQRSTYIRKIYQMMLPAFNAEDYPSLSEDDFAGRNFGKPSYYKRGFASGIRVSDLAHIEYISKKALKETITTTIKAIRREDASVIDERSYITWFAKSCAKNLAILHSTGRAHTQLLDKTANVTLAAEIVDTSGARYSNKPNLFLKDLGLMPFHSTGILRAVFDVLAFCNEVSKSVSFSREEIKELLLNTYKTEIARLYTERQSPPPATSEVPVWYTTAMAIESTPGN